MKDKYTASKVNKVCQDCWLQQSIENLICECGHGSFLPAEVLVLSKADRKEMDTLLALTEEDNPDFIG